MEKACLIGMAFLPVVHASFAAGQQAEDRGDVAVDTRTAFGKPPRSLHLEPVESLSVPKNPDIPYGMISRVHLYADRSHGSGEDSIYLVAEMNFCGEDGDQPHIVGIFAGSPAGEPCMRLVDLDRDGFLNWFWFMKREQELHICAFSAFPKNRMSPTIRAASPPLPC